MKSFKRTIMLTLSGLMLCGSAYAEGISINAVPDTKNGSVQVSGVMPSGNSDYTVMILKPGVKEEDITSGNFSENVNFIMSGKTDADGKFSVICYPLDEWSIEKQTVRVSGAAEGEGTFIYIDSTLEKKVVDAVNEASGEKIGKLLSKVL